MGNTVAAGLGIAWLLKAFLDLCGWKYMLSAKVREEKFWKQYQRGLVIPDLIVGIYMIILDVIFTRYLAYNEFWFCFFMILLVIIAFMLVIPLNRKYFGKITPW